MPNMNFDKETSKRCISHMEHPVRFTTYILKCPTNNSIWETRYVWTRYLLSTYLEATFSMNSFFQVVICLIWIIWIFAANVGLISHITTLKKEFIGNVASNKKFQKFYLYLKKKENTSHFHLLSWIFFRKLIHVDLSLTPGPSPICGFTWIFYKLPPPP